MKNIIFSLTIKTLIVFFVLIIAGCSKSSEPGSTGTAAPASGATAPCVELGAECSETTKCCSGLLCKEGICEVLESCGNGVCDRGETCTSCTTDCGTCADICAMAPDGTKCDDGNPCTHSDACLGKICHGVSYYCDDSKPCREGVCKGDGSCTYTQKDKTCLIAGICYIEGDTDGSCNECNSSSKTAWTPKTNGTTCDDRNPCTQSDSCQDGICKGTSKTCTAKDVCHIAGVCDPATGQCTNPATTDVTITCDDGKSCTSGDHCQGGQCVPKTSDCPCSLDTECRTPPDQCHNPSGTCNESVDPHKCVYEPLADNTVCDDGNLCTSNDTCQAGVCMGESAVCQAQDACHVAGVCNSSTGSCSNPNALDGTGCNDSIPCTENDKCTGGVCSGTQTLCISSNPCQNATGVCNQTLGNCDFTNKQDGTPCNDGDDHTFQDFCNEGVCAGWQRNCETNDDCQNVVDCYTGTCDTSAGIPPYRCIFNPMADGHSCEDGNPCTEGDHCNGNGTCSGGTLKECPETDCKLAGSPVPQGGQCVCVYNEFKSFETPCPRERDCAAKICDGSGNCIIDTGNDNCECKDAQDCIAKGYSVNQDICNCIVTCDNNTWTCGYTSCSNNTPCSDGNACTGPDTCQGGHCSGPEKVCTASDVCHIDGTCAPQSGVCSDPIANNGTQCDDGNPCTINDGCDGGLCHGTLHTCALPNQCQQSVACDGSGGCNYTNKPNGTGCTDGNVCTMVDSCQGGTCVSTPPITCAAAPECYNAGTCDSVTGCPDPRSPSLYKGNGVTCYSTGNPCHAEPYMCQAGYCSGPAGLRTCPDLACWWHGQCQIQGPGWYCQYEPIPASYFHNCAADPGNNECKRGDCDGSGHCIFRYNGALNTPCDDYDRCTIYDKCGAQDGVCHPGTPIDDYDRACKSGDPCCPGYACLKNLDTAGRGKCCIPGGASCTGRGSECCPGKSCSIGGGKAGEFTCK